MGKQKIRYKGVRYVAQALQKYLVKQYPSYKSALPKAREVFARLSDSKQKVTLKNILPYVRQGRKAKNEVPDLGIALLTPSPYFELQNYPLFIVRLTNRVWFRSKLWPVGLSDVQGGTKPSYAEYFAPFVNYVNALAQRVDSSEGSYETDWNVVCTVPVFSKARKRWESEIISIDGQGERYDYGFNPKKPFEAPGSAVSSSGTAKDDKVSSLKEKGALKATETTQEKPLSEDTALVQAQAEKAKAEVEMAKQQNINQLLKLFGEGQLSKAEFKDLMNKIK